MKRNHTPPLLFSSPAVNDSSVGNDAFAMNDNVINNNNSVNNSSDSINACLKRIRISSTSPGELALNSDLNHLAAEISLYQTNQTTWVSADHKFKLQRDEVDTLRLVFGISTDNNEEWTFCLQIPRMYPHQAPTIYRATCRNIRTLEQSQLPDILILNCPAPSTVSNTAPVFAVYNGWSPVNRLRDLVSWLVELANRPNLHPHHENSFIIQTQNPSHFRHHTMNIFDPNRFLVGFPTQSQAPKRSLSMSDIRFSTDCTSSNLPQNSSSTMDITGGHSEPSERFLTSCGSLAGAGHADRYGTGVGSFQGLTTNKMNHSTATGSSGNGGKSNQSTSYMMDSS